MQPESSQALVTLAAATTPRVESTPFRWRKLLALLPPPEGSDVSVAAFRGVGHALANHADRHGRRCFPPVELLMAESGYSERTVQRALAALADRGLIRRDTKGGRGRASEYVLVVPGAVDNAVGEYGATAERVPAGALKGATPGTPGPLGGPEVHDLPTARPVDHVLALADSPFAELALRCAIASGSTAPAFWAAAALEAVAG